MENSRPTQTQRVLQYIEDFGSITQFEALQDLGVMRLASRVSELKKDGYPITGKMATVYNRYGEKCSVKRYSLKKDGVENG